MFNTTWYATAARRAARHRSSPVGLCTIWALVILEDSILAREVKSQVCTATCVVVRFAAMLVCACDAAVRRDRDIERQLQEKEFLEVRLLPKSEIDLAALSLLRTFCSLWAVSTLILEVHAALSARRRLWIIDARPDSGRRPSTTAARGRPLKREARLALARRRWNIWPRLRAKTALCRPGACQWHRARLRIRQLARGVLVTSEFLQT